MRTSRWPQSRTPSRREDWARVNVLADACGHRVVDVLEALGVRVFRRGKMLAGACPVHGGRRPDAFNVYPEGHTVRGNWKCRSHACHLEFKKERKGSGTLLGLVWGVLSHQRLGWQGAGDRRVPFSDALNFLCGLLGTTLASVRVDMAEAEKRRFASQMETLGFVPRDGQAGWRLRDVRDRMECPAAYYLARGYSREVLDRYHVGLWVPGRGPESPMAGRVAVPVLDDEGVRVVGVTGRTTNLPCVRCELYHPPGDPCPARRAAAHCKWFNSPGFRKEARLYNYWSARDAIRATGVVVLVEGPGDVWRLVEGGVENAVAMFGNELSDPQQVVLECCGAHTAVLIPHRDGAGDESRLNVRRDLGRLFRLHFYDLKKKDVGEHSPDEVRDEIAPFLRGLEERQ